MSKRGFGPNEIPTTSFYHILISFNKLTIMIINIQLIGYPVSILWLSCSQRSLNYLVYFGVAYEGYSRDVSCALNEISTSLFLLVSEVAMQYSGS
jgi:hypothetical protein